MKTGLKIAGITIGIIGLAGSKTVRTKVRNAAVSTWEAAKVFGNDWKENFKAFGKKEDAEEAAK